MSPCPPRSRYVSKTTAVQRGLSPRRRHRETLRPVRVVTGGRVCSPPQGNGGRTACYAEHSPKRKTCPLIDETGTHRGRSPGLHDEGTHVVLGPYPVGRTHVETKRIAFATVFSDSDVPAVAWRFRVQADATVPSVSEMREAAATDLGRRGRGQLAECARVLGEREAMIDELRSSDAEVLRAARRVLRNAFFYGMYAQGWNGPETPFPPTRSAGAPSLRSRHVRVTEAGDVSLHDRGGTPADVVEHGRRTNMTDAYLIACFRSVDGLHVEKDRTFLTHRFLMAHDAPTTDGSYWPSDERLWDVLFGPPTGDGPPLDVVGRAIVRTCVMIAPRLYRSFPTWMVRQND